MKRHGARILALLLALTLTLGILPGVGFAADVVASGTCGAEGDGSNLTWTLDDEGTLTIRGTGEMAEYGYDQFGQFLSPPWYEQREAVTTLRIEKGATGIGSWTFRDCGHLTKVRFPVAAV